MVGSHHRRITDWMLAMAQWFVYIIRTHGGALYTGISTDVERRFQEHSGGSKGARALRGKSPLQLVYQQSVADRSVASKLEAAIKRLSKQRKEQLVAGDLLLMSLLSPE